MGPTKPYKALSSTIQVLYLLVEQKKKERLQCKTKPVSKFHSLDLLNRVDEQRAVLS